MTEGGLLRLRGAKRGAHILPLILLQRLVEKGDDGVAIEDAAEMLHCAPAQVVQRLSRLLEKAPDHHMLLGFLPGRVCLSGSTLISGTPEAALNVTWSRYKYNLRRRAAWREVQKLPAPPKTFTLPEASKALKTRSRRETERLLADWLNARYIGMFMMRDRPIFFGRLF